MSNLVVSETREVVRAQLMDAREMIQPVLPEHVNFDTCVATMYKHMYENPSLSECTPASLFWSFVQAAEVGLSVGGFFGEGFIIPFGSGRNPQAPKRARFIIGYKGLLKLCYQSPLIRRVDAYMVFEEDEFVPNLGRNDVSYVPYLGFKPPGKPVAAYVQIELSSGATKHHVMPMWRLEQIRKSAPGIRKPDHPWNTHPLEMYRKTGLRSALKDAPKNSETDRAIERAIRMDESADSEGAYDDVPQLPGMPEETSQPAGRAQATKDRVQAKRGSTRAKPAPVAAKPAPVAAKPAPVAAKPEPVAAKPEPVAAKPEPVAAKPEPVAAKPKPEPDKPAPSAETKPTPAATKPAQNAGTSGVKSTVVKPPDAATEPAKSAPAAKVSPQPIKPPADRPVEAPPQDDAATDDAGEEFFG